MKQIFLTSIVAFTLFSCQQEGKNTMYIQGNVEGLKRGVIYLQRFDNEGNIKNIDSVVAQGKGTFSFQVPLESPEVFALHLKKKTLKMILTDLSSLANLKLSPLIHTTKLLT